MAQARTSSYLPPDIDPTKTSLAFAERALPKLKEELQDPQLITRQRALMALCDLVHDPENVYQAANLGFLESLKHLLYDQDSTIREKTTEIFYTMAGHTIGREGILRSEIIIALSHLLDDPVNICRRNMHQTFEMLSELPAGSAALVDSDLLPLLVNKLESELEDIQVLILDTLHYCLKIDVVQALSAGAVDILKRKLTHPSVEIRSKAAYAIMQICVPLAGKDRVCQEEVVPLLIQLLEDSDSEVRANAAGSLMNITITTRGKYAAYHAGAIPKLLSLVNDSQSRVRLNCLKALTTLSEAPEGRNLLLKDVSLIQGCLADSSEAVRRAATIALQVIQWKP
ncbi:radial spoke head 14 homolog [Pelobates cultripes]|uniref:Radial spoke head 14 homolog n=2 Tax=Pelobates cultripes TaxID=61616 RepID=A0AAD1S921_PELCU|nr:radial spoke head 14 homolog [Pelobates cultripes]